MAVILKRQQYYLGCEVNLKTSDTTDILIFNIREKSDLDETRILIPNYSNESTVIIVSNFPFFRQTLEEWNSLPSDVADQGP